MERNVDPQCRGSGLPPGDLIYQRIDYWWLELLEDSLRGLSEFLYLYRKVRNSRKPKLQATLRRFSCPEYPAAPKISRRFCGLHSLGIIKMRSPAINGYLEPLVIGVAAATLLCGCSTPQKMGEAELESLGVRVGVLHWEASSRLGEKGYACSVTGANREQFDCSKTSGVLVTCILRVTFTVDEMNKISGIRIPDPACIGTP